MKNSNSPSSHISKTQCDSQEDQYANPKLPIATEQYDSSQLSDEFISSMVTLNVVKLSLYNMSQDQNSKNDLNQSKKLQHFKMDFDCSKCVLGEDETSLREFKQKVMEKFKLGDQFRIYNSDGILISDNDLDFLYESFDYDSYFKLYRRLNKLGEGGFGYVFLGKHMLTQEEVAIKVIRPTFVNNAQEADKIFQEAQTLQALDHQNIIKLRNVFQLPDNRIVMMMEYIEGGTLSQYLIDKGGRVNEDEAQRIMTQVTQAILYCHNKKIVHRDIKLDNILLNQKGDLSKGIKIIDFGIAGKTQFSLEQHKAGTLRYCPPELISEESFQADPSFDVWSIGVLLFRMLYGVFPFDGPTWRDTKQAIIKAKLKFPKGQEFSTISDTCKAIIKLFLNKEPHQRPPLYQIVRHPWFTQKNMNFIMNSTYFPQSTMMQFFQQSIKEMREEQDYSPQSPIIQKQSSFHEYVKKESNKRKAKSIYSRKQQFQVSRIGTRTNNHSVVRDLQKTNTAKQIKEHQQSIRSSIERNKFNLDEVRKQIPSNGSQVVNIQKILKDTKIKSQNNSNIPQQFTDIRQISDFQLPYTPSPHMVNEQFGAVPKTSSDSSFLNRVSNLTSFRGSPHPPINHINSNSELPSLQKNDNLSILGGSMQTSQSSKSFNNSKQNTVRFMKDISQKSQRNLQSQKDLHHFNIQLHQMAPLPVRELTQVKNARRSDIQLQQQQGKFKIKKQKTNIALVDEIQQKMLMNPNSIQIHQQNSEGSLRKDQILFGSFASLFEKQILEKKSQNNQALNSSAQAKKLLQFQKKFIKQ